MDSNALKLILDTASKGHEKRFFSPPPGTEPPNVYYVARPDGTVQKAEGDTLDNHACRDVATVVRQVEGRDFGEIWYDREGVVAVATATGDGHYDRYTLHLGDSGPFTVLVSWDANGTQTFTQQELWKLLRTTFRDALGGAYANVLGAVKRVDVRQEQQTSGTVSRTAVSMGKSVTATATGPELPELLTLFVPVFESPLVPTTAIVRVAFEFDAAKGAFELTVLPGEIERAYADAEGSLLKAILAAKEEFAVAAPVYHGKPHRQ